MAWSRLGESQAEIGPLSGQGRIQPCVSRELLPSRFRNVPVVLDRGRRPR